MRVRPDRETSDASFRMDIEMTAADAVALVQLLVATSIKIHVDGGMGGDHLVQA